MDRLLRQEIMNEVRQSLQQVAEQQEERYVSAKELMAYCGMFTRDWLKRYGHTLPRAQAVVVDQHGEKHKTGYAYALHRIQRMIREGEIERLQSVVVGN